MKLLASVAVALLLTACQAPCCDESIQLTKEAPMFQKFRPDSDFAQIHTCIETKCQKPARHLPPKKKQRKMPMK